MAQGGHGAVPRPRRHLRPGQKRLEQFIRHATGLPAWFDANRGNSCSKAAIRVPRSAIALIHTHPAWGGGQPSGPDIDSAKAFGKSIYVVSKSGLQVADKFGKVTNVYNDPNWYDEANPK